MKTAYPNLEQPVAIRLYSNIPFDNTYEHHSLISERFKYNGSYIYHGISTATAKERFIDRRRNVPSSPYYYSRYDLSGEFNFDFKNGLVGSVTLELTPEQTNANYMRVTCAGSDINDVYYYFITAINQINYNTYTLSLELDVLMTYQDEFLDGVSDTPVFTQRKHCHRYTNNGLVPHCADFKTGDSAFAGIKPSVIEDVLQLEFSGEMAKIKDVKWLYVCVDPDYVDETYKKEMLYAFKNVKHPLAMICVPLNAKITFNLTGEGLTPYTPVYDQSDVSELIEDLVGSGKVHSCKVSSYPPFYSASITKNATNDFTINGIYYTENGMVIHSNYKTKLYMDNLHTPATRFLVILNENAYAYSYTYCNLGLINNSAPTILSNRYKDPKLLFAPFRKYLLSAVYSSGNEFFPELGFSDGVFNNSYFYFETMYTSYIGDFNIFTYQRPIQDVNSNYFYSDYKINNIGLSTNVNYNIPCGLNALDSFNQSQAQSFYQSKVASGITSGITIAGGIASIGIGAVAGGLGFVTGGSTSIMGAGMVASGLSAIGMGTAGVTNAIKSTNAKIEDLKNTPDTINVQGGSFVSDYARNNDLPFVVIYECTEVVKHNADDYFYNFGYEMARDCLFNTELKYNNDLSKIVDNNIFGRTIFNYVKLNEDITNKINENIPYVIKQKISQIFNNGITLWTSFH